MARIGRLLMLLALIATISVSKPRTAYAECSWPYDSCGNFYTACDSWCVGCIAQFGCLEGEDGCVVYDACYCCP